MNITELVVRQRAYFMTGATRPLSFRLSALQKLRSALLANQAVLEEALRSDLNKSPFEAYITEIGFVLEELSFHIRHLPAGSASSACPPRLRNFTRRASYPLSLMASC